MNVAPMDSELRSIIRDVGESLRERSKAYVSGLECRFLCDLIGRLGYATEDPRVRRVIKNYFLDSPSVKLLRQTEESAEQVRFVKDWTDYLRAVAQGKYGLSKPDAEDVASKTWIALLGSLDQFEYPARLRTYAFAILSHAVYKEPNSDGSRTVSLDESWEEGASKLEHVADMSPLPDAVVARGDYETRLRAVVASAVERCCEVMRNAQISREEKHRIGALSFSDDLSPREIAEDLGLEANDVRVIVHRIRKRMKADAELREILAERLDLQLSERTNPDPGCDGCQDRRRQTHENGGLTEAKR